jgi:hypothetical protein
MINDISDGRVAFPALLTFISYIQFITFPISQSHVLNVHSCFNFRSPPLMASMILVEKRYHEVKHVKNCANMKTQTQKASCCIYEKLGLRARCKCHHFSNYLCENWTRRPNLKNTQLKTTGRPRKTEFKISVQRKPGLDSKAMGCTCPHAFLGIQTTPT